MNNQYRLIFKIFNITYLSSEPANKTIGTTPLFHVPWNSNSVDTADKDKNLVSHLDFKIKMYLNRYVPK